MDTSIKSNELMTPKMWSETIELPTYEVGEPNKNPLFLEKRVYQGSSGKIYPMPFTDSISDEKVMKSYEVVFLENAYIKVMIMPEMGGKIYRALDKTNNYDFVYYNQVVKPALVGLVGPWVSGGIEFNWPQHHRPSTFMPVEYTLVDNENGSKTCWISEIDRMYGTKGNAGFTIYQDKAYIEIKGQLYNRTETPQTFLWWANPAVAVNDYTKSIFPPDVHAVFDHGKRDVSKFPIATGTYYKMDYSDGVDISRYKNIPVPTSYMAYHSDYNFVGGYDFGVDAGILHIANHHISPGKKQWTWGNGDFGQAWDRNLTDEDGPYIELMTGVYTDNQPDFTWLSPKESKTFVQYFMPYKSIGEVKNACLDGMINLEMDGQEIHMSVYVPTPKKGLKVILSEDGTEIFTDVIEKLTPEWAYKKSIRPVEVKSCHHYRLQLLDSDGYEIISYQPREPEILETPDPATAPNAPEDMPSCEDLLLTGQHIEQYRHATYLPEDYYLEALKRNPMDIRNNNAYGLLMYRRGCFQTAMEHFTRAVKASIRRNPNPYDSEPYYNLGLALRRLGRTEEAYSAFYKATWSGAWQNSGYYEIAAIDTLKKDYTLALDHISKSIARNSYDIKARGLKSALLRRTGQLKEAKAFVKETLALDCNAFTALYEKYKLVDAEKDSATDEKAMLIRLLRGFHQNYIELASDYGRAGLYEEAMDVLSIYLAAVGDEEAYPMIHYFMGYYAGKIGDEVTMDLNYSMGAAAKPDYCFPHRLDELQVLEAAIDYDNKDSKALYYLGNLYYDKRQYDKAMTLWEKSIDIDPLYPTASRNLALAYVNKKCDMEQGLKYLETAFKSNKEDARVFFELDQLYKKLNESFEKRHEVMVSYIDLVYSRDDLYVEYLTVLNNIGQYQKVMKEMDGHIFKPWEGGEGKVTAQYKRCRIELAKAALKSGQYDHAVKLLKGCKIYPHNLGEGKLQNAAENDIDYLLGDAYEKLGQEDRANEYYKLASTGIDEPTDAMFYNDQPADMMFYQGMAFRKLGDEKRAKSEFNRMFDYGEKHIHDEVKIDYFAVSLPDFLVFDEDLNTKNEIHCKYLMALGLMGNGDVTLAMKYLKECHEVNSSHQGVLFHMKDLSLLAL